MLAFLLVSCSQTTNTEYVDVKDEHLLKSLAEARKNAKIDLYILDFTCANFIFDTMKLIDKKLIIDYILIIVPSLFLALCDYIWPSVDRSFGEALGYHAFPAGIFIALLVIRDIKRRSDKTIKLFDKALILNYILILLPSLLLALCGYLLKLGGNYMEILGIYGFPIGIFIALITDRAIAKKQSKGK